MKNVQRLKGFKSAPFRSVRSRCGQHKIHWFLMEGTDGAVPFLDDLVLTTESKHPFMRLDLAENSEFAFQGFVTGTLVYRGIPMRWSRYEVASVERWLQDLLERGIMKGEAP